MSDTEPKTIDAIVKRDFTDAGTERSFTRSDKSVPIKEGEFVNYLAAGLVEFAPVADPAPADGAAVEETPAKSRSTRG